jgi:hypothetical protein
MYVPMLIHVKEFNELNQESAMGFIFNHIHRQRKD